MAGSLAERFRRARLAFEAGCAMGCSPRDAADRLRWDAAERRLAARMKSGPRGESVSVAAAPERSEPWYRQGDMA